MYLFAIIARNMRLCPYKSEKLGALYKMIIAWYNAIRTFLLGEHMESARKDPLGKLSGIIFALMILLVVLQVIDVLSTIHGIALENIWMETNPIARAVMTRFGSSGLWYLKLTIFMFVLPGGLIANLLRHRHHSHARGILFFLLGACSMLNVLYLFVVANNLHSITH